jgi:hypothetical protein
MNLGHVYVVRTTLSKPPKDKIVLCVCDQQNLFFWFNTKPSPRGVGQLLCEPTDHNALTHQCYLDLSRVTTLLPLEINAAQDRGTITKTFADKAIEALNAGVKTLTPN